MPSDRKPHRKRNAMRSPELLPSQGAKPDGRHTGGLARRNREGISNRPAAGSWRQVGGVTWPSRSAGDQDPDLALGWRLPAAVSAGGCGVRCGRSVPPVMGEGENPVKPYLNYFFNLFY